MKKTHKYAHNTARDLWVDAQKSGERHEWWETQQGGLRITILYYPDLARAGVATNGNAVWVDAYSPQQALLTALSGGPK